MTRSARKVSAAPLDDGSYPLELECLRRVRSGERARQVLRRLFRRHDELGDADRARVARRVLAVSCLSRRLDYLFHRRDGTPASPQQRLATFLVTEEKESAPAAANRCGLTPDERRRLEETAQAPPRWPADRLARLRVERSLPDWLAELWSNELGSDEADGLAAAMNRPGPTTLRANTLRIDRDRLAERLEAEGIRSSPGRSSPWALHLHAHANLIGSPSWRDGLFEVQDEASQIAALATQARPGDVCVDLCAGAGGKTLALAAMMKGEGEIVATDADPLRLGHLPARLVRAGVDIVRQVRLAEALELRETADVVLVDAPCSSLGTLRRDPERRWLIDPLSLVEHATVQRALLARAAALLKPGGRLVYATCTVREEENEAVARWLDLHHPEVERSPPWTALPDGRGDALKLLSHHHGTDSFFVCAWRRQSR